MGATYISESPQWECVTQATGKNKLKRKNSGRSCILPNPWSCLKPNQKRSFQFHEYSTNFCETVLCDAWKCSSFFSVKLHKGTDGILLKVSRESKEEVSVYAERVTCAYFKKHQKKPPNFLPKPKCPKPHTLFFPSSNCFSFSCPPSLHFHIYHQLLFHHQPTSPQSSLIPKTHWHPHLCLMLHSHRSQPSAPCQVKWTVLASGESRVLNSAQLSWAASVINLVCDYCRSQAPPRRKCALMGTMSPGTGPAVARGMREQKERLKLRREKSTEREEKNC